MSIPGTHTSARPNRARALFCVALLLGLVGCKREAEADAVEPPPDAGTETKLAATSSPAANDVGGKPRGIGQVAHAPSYEMVLLGAKTCPPPAWHHIKAGYTRLGVEVELRGKSKSQRVPANPFYARLVDPEGKAYRPVFGGCEPDLRHTPLGVDDSVRAYITFEIPEATGRLQLRYDPQLKSPEALEFDLGVSPATADSAKP
ncbi:MAG: DUF4352 domain-containing protein [Polyangiaceae bacterium]|nr:DUF4352 domain-containing protein [Polyangiaceae bacterium]